MNGDGPPPTPPYRPYGRQRFRPGSSGAPQPSAVGGGKSPYRLGRDFERATRGRLERRGYFVMRATLSKGKIDLLAAKTIVTDYCGYCGYCEGHSETCRERHTGYPRAHLVLGVQCKRRGDIGSVEWNELVDLCEPFGITPVVATKTGERTTAFYRLDERREFGRQGRPWTEINPQTCEPVPTQLAIVR